MFLEELFVGLSSSEEINELGFENQKKTGRLSKSIDIDPIFSHCLSLSTLITATPYHVSFTLDMLHSSKKSFSIIDSG